MIKSVLPPLQILALTFITCSGKAFPGTVINYGQTFGFPRASGNVVNYGQSFGPSQLNPNQEQLIQQTSFQTTRNQNQAAPTRIFNNANLDIGTAPNTIAQPDPSQINPNQVQLTQQTSIQATRNQNQSVNPGIASTRIFNQVNLSRGTAPITIKQPVLASSPQTNKIPDQVVRSITSGLSQFGPVKVSNKINLNGNRAPITIEQPVIQNNSQSIQTITANSAQELASASVVRSPTLPIGNQNQIVEGPALSIRNSSNALRVRTSPNGYPGGQVEIYNTISSGVRNVVFN